MRRESVTQIRRRNRVGAVSFTAYDPSCDRDGRVARIAVDLAATMAGMDSPA